MALLARTGNVNAEELYTFFTNDTNAQNNIISIGGQVAGITIGLTAASLLYATFRAGSNPNVTDFQIDSLVNDLTRDQTAAQNIISSLAYAIILSGNYFILAQLGEPANRRRRIFDEFIQFGEKITNRQGAFNPFDLVFGLLDGVLSYGTVLRTVVFYALGASAVIFFWLLMSFLPNTPPGRKKRSSSVFSKINLENDKINRILLQVHDDQFDMT